jgi:outer membrane protein TolC
MMESVWGSAGGKLLSWGPFDFGLRKSNVELARAVGRQASANEAVTRLDVAAAFLTLLAADQTLEAAQAGVECAEIIARAVRALVENQPRPGVGASRAEAELSAARNQLIHPTAPDGGGPKGARRMIKTRLSPHTSAVDGFLLGFLP